MEEWGTQHVAVSGKKPVSTPSKLFSFPFRNCGCPVLAFFARAGAMLPIPSAVMPSGLHRTYGAHHLHFITNSCYQRRPLLGSPRARDLFLSLLEEARQRYDFVVVGYVVMPEHVHLLITEPEVGSPSTVMQVLKQRTAWALLPKRRRRDPRQRDLFHQEGQRSLAAALLRFQRMEHEKRVEKLRYMHRNPVKRGLVDSPEKWRWSSYRHYLFDEAGPVKVNVGWGEISFRDHVA
jgi:putative transposase